MNSAHPTSQIYQTLAERLIGILRASISLILMSVNTLVLCIPIYLIALLRTISSDRLKPTWTEHAMSIAEYWISFNNLVLDSSYAKLLGPTVDSTLFESGFIIDFYVQG